MRKKSKYRKRTFKDRILTFLTKVILVSLIIWCLIVCVLYGVAQLGLSCDPKVLVMHYSGPTTIVYAIILIVSRIIIGTL